MFYCHLQSALYLELGEQQAQLVLFLVARTLILHFLAICSGILPKPKGILLLLPVRNGLRSGVAADRVLVHHSRAGSSLVVLDCLWHRALFGDNSEAGIARREGGADAGQKRKGSVLEAKERKRDGIQVEANC